MKRTLLIATTLVAVATLTGCALFYPNLGSNETPSDPMNPSPSATETSTTPTETPTATPTPKELAKPRVLFYEIAGSNFKSSEKSLTLPKTAASASSLFTLAIHLLSWNEFQPSTTLVPLSAFL